ncbi:MAG: NADH-quinone oxidoreductase subunit H [Desulfurococcales archaeon]|nr:NADH-quinone oxidoreductase subunit H [Desulfurococcales archaeon]
MWEALTVVFEVLVFPGFLFVIALALLSEWWIRKVVARAQNRMGPSYVGPAGILQPFADFIKLMSVKEEIKQKYSTLTIAKVFTLFGFGAVIAALLLLPISPVRLSSSYDIVVLSYLCCVWVPFTIVVIGLSTPNPFSNAGVSRLLSMYALCEPAYFMSILVPAALVTKLFSPAQPYSVFATSYHAWQLWLNPYTAVLMALALFGVTVSTQAKAMLQPFNIPEAEQEIVAGFMTELSGPMLGLTHLLHDIDTSVTLLITVYLLLGGPYPFPHLSLPGFLMVVTKYLALLTVLSVIEASYGRLRIEQALSVIGRYSIIPSLIALVATMII